jgi:hypothetical protein
MPNDTGPHHVQVDIDHAAHKILGRIHDGRVVAVFPERAAPLPAAVVLLRRSAGDQLHAGRDLIAAAIEREQMNMVVSDLIVERTQSKTFARLE